MFSHPSLKRAKNAVRKRVLFTPREPMFVRGAMLAKMVQTLEENPRQKFLVMMLLAAYVFLLRVPSEAIPMAAHSTTR